MIQYLLTALIDALVAGIALSKRRDGAAISLALLALSAGLWSVELYLLTIIASPEVLKPWFLLFRTGMFFIPSTMTLFVWFLVGKRSLFFLYSVVIPGLTISAGLAFLNNFIFQSSLKPAENGFTAEIDAIYIAYVATFVWCLIGAIIFCITQYKKVSVREKQRIKWLSITLAVAFLFGITSLYLFSYSFYLSKLSGPLTNVVFLSSLLYATIKHDLMDIRMALGVGLSRVLLLTVFCWTYFSLSSAEIFTADTIGGTITLLLFFAIALEVYPKMVSWLTPNTRRIFRAAKFDFDKLRLKLQIDLDKCISFENVTEVLDAVFIHQAGLERFKVLIKEESDNSDQVRFRELSRAFEFELTQEALGSLVDGGDTKIRLVDEVQHETQKLLNETSTEGIVSLCIEGELIGLMLLAKPNESKYFDFDIIQLIEWVAGELPQTLWRIKSIEVFEEELNEAKKQLSLISIMNHYHHDIKAPLAIIDGVVTHEIYDKEKQRRIILEQVALGSRLITTMAGLLKGRRQRNVGPVSINDVIQDCILIFNHALSGSVVEVGDDAVVLGDPDDLKILFINVIKNACEAANNERKVSIQVKAWKEESSLKVSIKDDGVGIAMDRLDGILTSGKTTKKGGSGVGMQAIKRIADEHKAVINIESLPGRGTDFTLVFPLSA